MIYNYLIYFFLLAGVVLSIVTHKLTVKAALLGGVVGLLVFKGGGYTGLIMLASFFILGSGATGLGLKKKQALGAADENKGRRTPGQVMANGGVAAMLGAVAIGKFFLLRDYGHYARTSSGIPRCNWAL